MAAGIALRAMKTSDTSRITLSVTTWLAAKTTIKRPIAAISHGYWSRSTPLLARHLRTRLPRATRRRSGIRKKPWSSMNAEKPESPSEPAGSPDR